jgi:hypothetical protein
MTSFAFILGVFPLVVADGAGAAGQRALGTAVFGGMIASTLLSVFFVPVFFLMLQHVSEWWKPLKFDSADDLNGESSIHHNAHPSQIQVFAGAGVAGEGNGSDGH